MHARGGRPRQSDRSSTKSRTTRSILSSALRRRLPIGTRARRTCLVAAQRSPAPVHRDEREEAVLNLVPLARARRHGAGKTCSQALTSPLRPSRRASRSLSEIARPSPAISAHRRDLSVSLHVSTGPPPIDPGQKRRDGVSAFVLSDLRRPSRRSRCGSRAIEFRRGCSRPPARSRRALPRSPRRRCRTR